MKSLEQPQDNKKTGIAASMPNTLRTWSEGLEVDTCFKMYQNLNIQTGVEAIKTDAPVLGLLKKENEEKTSGLIELMIIDLQNFLNINRTMNPYQIKETARLILQRYNYFKISDCKFVFDLIKTGQIKIFEGLDGQKILTAFESWANDRWQTADNLSHNQHLETVGNEKQRRDKPFAIGNPDAPASEQIKGYMDNVAKMINK